MSSVGSSASSIIILILAFAAHTSSYLKKRDTKPSIYPNPSLNFTTRTAKNGYKTEEHSVTTEDGYVLQVFRIVLGKKCNEKKRLPPVLLMHGLLESSDAWIDAGLNAGLAYLISDACFDLWLGNFRGNYYSRKHVRLDPNTDAEFWHFSVDEMGMFDVPAMIDYILAKTRVEQLNYIGFSQGGGSFFIMCSEKPGYCKKVKVMIGLAPATRHYNTRSPRFRLGTEAFGITQYILRAFGVEEVLSKGAPTQQILSLFCRLSLIAEFCNLGLSIVDFYHPGSVSDETLKEIFNHFPAGTSLQNMVRYGQSMINPDFVKYDYGKAKNMELYGKERPPKYNLSAVTAPVVIMYGKNDAIVDTRDVKWLAERLPNAIDMVEVKDPLWNHLDFNFSQHIRKLILPKVLEHLLANNTIGGQIIKNGTEIFDFSSLIDLL